MDRRTGFWVGWALVAAPLPSLFLGDLTAFQTSWLALVVGVLFLGVVAADRLVGRAIRPQHASWADALLVVGLLAALGGVWAWFAVIEPAELRVYGGALAIVPLTAVALPIVRFVGEGRPAGCFWPLVVIGSALSSVGVVVAMGFAGEWIPPSYPLFVGTTATLAMAWTLFGVVALVWKLAAGWPEDPPPRRWMATALAGALVGCAHLGTWFWIHMAYRTTYSWSEPSAAYLTAMIANSFLVDGLAVYAIGALLGGTVVDAVTEETADAH
jgi:hypothetical protein